MRRVIVSVVFTHEEIVPDDFDNSEAEAMKDRLIDEVDEDIPGYLVASSTVAVYGEVTRG